MAVASVQQLAQWSVSAGFSTGTAEPMATTAVAVALAHGADPAQPTGAWGVGGGTGDGADQAKMALTVYETRGWAGMPSYADGSAQRVLLTRAREIQGAVTGIAQTNKPPISGNPLQVAEQLAERFTDPLLWRGILFTGIGFTLVAVGVFALTVPPVTRGLVRTFIKADNAALRVAQVNENVVQPYRRYRKAKKATTP